MDQIKKNTEELRLRVQIIIFQNKYYILNIWLQTLTGFGTIIITEFAKFTEKFILIHFKSSRK